MIKRLALTACSCALIASPLFAASTSSNSDQSSSPDASTPPPKQSLLHRIWPFDRHSPKTENRGAPQNGGTEIIKVVPTDVVKRSQKLIRSVRSSEELQKKNEHHSAVANSEPQKTPLAPKTAKKAAQSLAAETPNADQSSPEPISKTANHEKKTAKTSTGFSAPISFIPDSTATAETPKADASFGNKLIEDETQDRSRYETLKKKALADEKIQKLKEKADSALTDEESRAATKAYYHALFSKIHQLNSESSFDGYINRMQAALTKRLDEKTM